MKKLYITLSLLMTFLFLGNVHAQEAIAGRATQGDQFGKKLLIDFANETYEMNDTCSDPNVSIQSHRIYQYLSEETSKEPTMDYHWYSESFTYNARWAQSYGYSSLSSNYTYNNGMFLRPYNYTTYHNNNVYSQGTIGTGWSYLQPSDTHQHTPYKTIGNLNYYVGSHHYVITASSYPRLWIDTAGSTYVFLKVSARDSIGNSIPYSDIRVNGQTPDTGGIVYLFVSSWYPTLDHPWYYVDQNGTPMAPYYNAFINLSVTVQGQSYFTYDLTFGF